jgi:nucleoside-specific outer membrane channel protein Tsx
MQSANAEDWSDTSLGYRYGTQFSEPYNPNSIAKNIFDLNHVSGYKYGINFFHVDVLLSDSNDPASAKSTNGAQEIYVIYRHTLDLGKVMDRSFQFGPVADLGLTAGFDLNTKTDAGYNSKKRMLVVGPTLMMDVPGFMNISLLLAHESNAPYSTYTGVDTPRYTYDIHPMLSLAWGIPFSIGIASFSFDGYANFIAPKGKNEFGGDTVAETDIFLQLMYDLSYSLGARNNTFKVGLAYEYWKNKFGNDAAGPAGPGAFAKTPMIRAEYHF